MNYTLKTKKNAGTVKEYVDSITDTKRKKQAKTLLKLFKDITGKRPIMWGTSIVGYGTYMYTYASGHSGEWMRTGFSARAQGFSLYIMPGYQNLDPLLKKLGPHRHGKSCLIIRDLDRVDLKVLEQIIRKGLKEMTKHYPENGN